MGTSEKSVTRGPLSYILIFGNLVAATRSAQHIYVHHIEAMTVRPGGRLLLVPDTVRGG